MEAWKGEDLDAADATTWLRLMNASTANLGVQFFSPNVVASPFDNASLDDSIQYNNDTLVIWNTGDLPSPGAIVGIAIGFSIVFLAVLVWLNWKRMLSPVIYSQASTTHDNAGRAPLPQNRFTPRENANTGYTTTGISTGPIEMAERQHHDFADMGMHGTSAEKFVELIHMHYGEQAATERQLRETGPDASMADDVQTEGVEEIMDMARRMLRFDTEVWSHRNTVGFSESDRTAIDEKCEALQREMTARVQRWESCDGWQPEEIRDLEEIKTLFRIEPSSGIAPEPTIGIVEEGRYDWPTKSSTMPSSSDWASSARSRRGREDTYGGQGL